MKGRSSQGSTPAMTLLTVRGDGARIDGRFVADALEVQCEVSGELDIGERLVIGEQGVVDAQVRTTDAVIMGTFNGRMVATGRVEIAPTGRVTGDIYTDCLIINEGGYIRGAVSKLASLGTDSRPTTVEAPRPTAPAYDPAAESSRRALVLQD